ncbi:uncharacterized protein LOC132203854 [Neocloeon triangulifer]|uniref:uncharacterized protein LOC132203854 n=1 Tax=Neocloeon triangulifer TaxID=2078957 RepID=UPI00286ECC62|nr:uncharacterized protein LOC132203854 [Neocloeon triangulifer]XP_059487985.1 uncharacterized protein LOC132203854 [Neocloeon triangulifer]
MENVEEMMNMELYHMLDVHPEAEWSIVNRACLKAIKLYHPDRHQMDHELLSQRTALTQHLNSIKDVLQPSHRDIYDWLGFELVKESKANGYEVQDREIIESLKARREPPVKQFQFKKPEQVVNMRLMFTTMKGIFLSPIGNAEEGLEVVMHGVIWSPAIRTELESFRHRLFQVHLANTPWNPSMSVPHVIFKMVDGSTLNEKFGAAEVEVFHNIYELPRPELKGRTNSCRLATFLDPNNFVVYTKQMFNIHEIILMRAKSHLARNFPFQKANWWHLNDLVVVIKEDGDVQRGLLLLVGTSSCVVCLVDIVEVTEVSLENIYCLPWSYLVAPRAVWCSFQVKINNWARSDSEKFQQKFRATNEVTFMRQNDAQKWVVKMVSEEDWDNDAKDYLIRTGLVNEAKKTKVSLNQAFKNAYKKKEKDPQRFLKVQSKVTKKRLQRRKIKKEKRRDKGLPQSSIQ